MDYLGLSMCVLMGFLILTPLLIISFVHGNSSRKNKELFKTDEGKKSKKKWLRVTLSLALVYPVVTVVFSFILFTRLPLWTSLGVSMLMGLMALLFSLSIVERKRNNEYESIEMNIMRAAAKTREEDGEE